MFEGGRSSFGGAGPGFRAGEGIETIPLSR